MDMISEGRLLRGGKQASRAVDVFLDGSQDECSHGMLAGMLIRERGFKKGSGCLRVKIIIEHSPLCRELLKRSPGDELGLGPPFS
jgi:hypothetical protein